jgi:hypothetical protein
MSRKIKTEVTSCLLWRSLGCKYIALICTSMHACDVGTLEDATPHLSPRILLLASTVEAQRLIESNKQSWVVV